MYDPRGGQLRYLIQFSDGGSGMRVLDERLDAVGPHPHDHALAPAGELREHEPAAVRRLVRALHDGARMLDPGSAAAARSRRRSR